MAVDLNDHPAEGPPLVCKGLDAQHIVDPAVDLHAVAVYDGNEVLQPVVAGGHGGFPDQTLLAFAVTQQNVGHIVLMVLLGRQGHTQADGQTVSQRAGAHVQAWYFVFVRVTLEDGMVLTQRVQKRLVKEAALCQCGVQRRAGMSFGKNKAVAVGPVGVGRVNVHNMEIERRNKIRGRKRTTRMAGLGMVDHLQDVVAEDRSCVLQPSDVLLCEIIPIQRKHLLL